MLVINLIIAIATLAQAAINPSLVAVQKPGAIADLFGVAPDASIWHMSTGSGQASKFDRVPAHVNVAPCSFRHSGRLDIFYLNVSNGNVLHRYESERQWYPSLESAEDLGGDDFDSIACVNEGEYVGVVGRAKNGSYLAKFLSDQHMFPNGQGWLNLGGNFSSHPAVSIEGPLVVSGISAQDGSMMQTFVYQYQRKVYWDNISGGPFVGSPKMIPHRYGIYTFALNKTGQVSYYPAFSEENPGGWQTLGGAFAEVPQPASWENSQGEAVIALVGKGRDESRYYFKVLEHDKWKPSGSEWAPLANVYASEPAVTGSAQFVSIFGLASNGSLLTQIYLTLADAWFPSKESANNLGDASKPYSVPIANDNSQSTIPFFNDL